MVKVKVRMYRELVDGFDASGNNLTNPVHIIESLSKTFAESLGSISGSLE